MKKWLISIFGLLVFLTSYQYVYAVCDTSTLNNLNSQARKVKPSYELKKEQIKIEDGFPDGLTEEEKQNYYMTVSYYMIYINNMTKDLYIKVSDDLSKEEKTYTYDQAENGVISFRLDSFSELRTYTITVYASDVNGDCANEKLYSTNLVIPYYNVYSGWEPCKGIEEFYLCHEYLNVKVNKTESEFLNSVNEYKKGLINKDGEEVGKKEDGNKAWNFIKKNKVVLIIATAVVISGGIATVILIKKKRVNEE